MLLPPNVTAVIQPNPIKITKLLNKNELLRSIIAQENASIPELLKKHDITHAIILLQSVWEKLPVSVLQSAWLKINNWDEKEYDSEDDSPLSQLLLSENVYGNIVEHNSFWCKSPQAAVIL